MSPLHHYTRIIRDNPLLSQADTVALLRVIRDPSAPEADRRAARDRIILSNLRIVIRLARGYRANGLELDDFVSAGQFGLVTAIENYDESRGAFSTCAARYVLTAILHSVPDRSVVRLPHWAYWRVGQYRRAADKLRTDRNGRTPTEDEVFDAMGLRESRRETMRRAIAIGTAADLDADRVCDPDTTLEDRESVRHEYAKAIAILSDKLPPRTLDMLHRVYGRGETLDSVGQDYGICRERVRQIVLFALAEAKALVAGEYGGSTLRAKQAAEAQYFPSKRRYRAQKAA